MPASQTPSLWQRTTRPTKLFLFYAAIILITIGAMIVFWRDYDAHPEEWVHSGHRDAVQHSARTLNTLDISMARDDVPGDMGIDCEECKDKWRVCIHDCHKHVIQCNWECECEVMKRDPFCQDQCKFKCGSGWRA